MKQHPLGILNSPQSVARAYLQAWQFQDYKRMVKAMQLTYMSKIYRQSWQGMEFEELKKFLTSTAIEGKPPQAQLAIVAGNFNRFRIKSFEIIKELKPSKGVNPMVQRHILVDIDFGQGVKRYKVVVNCETKPYNASPNGIWGVYPTSRIKGVA